MERPNDQPQHFDVPALLAKLGITDDMSSDAPPEWVLKPLTPEQRHAFAQLVLHTTTTGFGHPTCHALVLLRLALQPGLPQQGAGFLAFAAAELMAHVLLDNNRHGRGAVDIATALGLVQAAEADVAHVADEDVDQDAGNELGVGV